MAASPARPDAHAEPAVVRPERPGRRVSYARARLLLGVSGVGLWVVVASAALALGAAEWLHQKTTGDLSLGIAALAGLVALHAVVQAPLDVLGGHVLPRWYGRSDPGFGRFAIRWARGVAVWNGALLLIAIGLLLAGLTSGAAGVAAIVVAAAVGLSLACLPIARLAAPLPMTGPIGRSDDGVIWLASDDPGFTGGITGVVRARASIMPSRWKRMLDDDARQLAQRRRKTAIESGLWRRGQLVAWCFVLTGAVISALLARDLAGSAGGVLKFSLLFTLWSFLGLLVLPTLSRRGTDAIDAILLSEGCDRECLASLAASLDRLQDDEPERAAWIERIFHPIPNAATRAAMPHRQRFAAWHAARTSIVLGLAAGSLLGRSVHCNVGRPDLWVMLPTD